MRLGSQITGWSVLAGVLLGAISSAELVAQTRPNTQPAPRTANPSPAKAAKPSVSGSLTPDEGLAILGAALESRYKVEARSDCSHLVHAIYEKAGFHYAYESSSDLYAGEGSFRRVTQPQPGDVVVWPGHAGIVVSPLQRTFFSALRSGLGVQAYDSVYWKERGHPRFLRYLKASPEAVLVAAKRTPTLEPARLRTDGAGTPIVTEADDPEDMDAEEESGMRLDVPAVTAPLPTVVVVTGMQPKPEQVHEALLGEFRDAADALQGQDVFKLHAELVAFGRCEVRKLHLNRDSSWAEIRLVDLVSVTAPAGRAKKHAEVQRWNLRRKSAGNWQLVLPTDAVYLPREAAVRILAHQLAALTDEDSDSAASTDQKAQLARWVAVLLEERSH
jgi:hypothetical protein